MIARAEEKGAAARTTNSERARLLKLQDWANIKGGKERGTLRRQGDAAQPAAGLRCPESCPVAGPMPQSW